MYSDNEIKVIGNLLNNGDISGWFKSHDGGNFLQAFQKRFADFCGTSHAFAVSSGSASIYVALRSVGVGEGDYVLVSPYTHIGTVAPIILCGARPLFVDTDSYGNIDPRCMEETAKHTMKAKAVIAVHICGMPCDMDGINDVAKMHNLWVIEDASHALGAKWKGIKAGNLGDIGCFSVGGGRTKTIGTGEGGVVTTNNADLAAKIRNIRNHGDRVDDCPYFCFNFRLSDLQALIGLIQMMNVQTMIDWQVRNAEHIIKHLPDYLHVYDPPEHAEPVHYMVDCRFHDEMHGRDRSDFLKFLNNVGLGCGVPRRNIGAGFSKLISDIRYYKSYAVAVPNAEKVRDSSIWIDWHRPPRNTADADELLKILDKFDG